MKTIDQIRRERLALLRTESGGVNQLAARLGKAPAQVSAWLNASANSGSGRPRGISDDACREMEEACGKPRGWMDTDPELLHPVDLMQLIAMFVQCDESDRSFIMDSARSIFKRNHAGGLSIIDKA